jgi:hypothetical protein
VEVFVPETSGQKNQWNFSCQRLQDKKFQRIFHAGDSRTKNSVEFFVPETPGRKIPKNFSCQRLQDEKFQRIFHARDSRTKNSKEFQISYLYRIKII